MAIAVLAVLLVVSLTPILSSFRTLGEAKATDVVENLGQARIEAVRSLDFTDVGVAGGSPDGTLIETENVEIQGIDMRIDTSVEWVGSASGLDIVPGGGDGVPGFYDPGIDYKLVRVTVTPLGTTGDPVVFETIISPPNVAAAEDSANLIADIAKILEPSGQESLTTDQPRIYLVHDAGFVAGTVGAESPLFANLLPDTDYRIRLGPTDADLDDGTWRLSDPDLTVSVGTATTLTQRVDVYRMTTLVVSVQDDTGLPLSNATLLVRDGVGTEWPFTTADPGFDGPTATWTITELDGEPVRPGDYELVASAPAHEEDSVMVTAPVGYPNDMVHEATVQLVPAAAAGTTELTVTVTDAAGRALPLSNVVVSESSFGTITRSVPKSGQVVIYIPTGLTVDVDVTSPYGHSSSSGSLNLTAPTHADAVTLATPFLSALLGLESATGSDFPGHFVYRPVGSGGDDWTEVEPNDGGQGSVVVGDNPSDIYDTWEAGVVCDDDPTSIQQVQSAPFLDRLDRTFTFAGCA